MKRVLTAAAAMRREDRLQQREDRLTEKTSDLRAQIASLTAENERLRVLVEDAYYEGNDDAVHGYGRDWLGSDSYAALQPKEEIQ